MRAVVAHLRLREAVDGEDGADAVGLGEGDAAQAHCGGMKMGGVVGVHSRRLPISRLRR
jgi:hypothetical protein